MPSHRSLLVALLLFGTAGGLRADSAATPPPKAEPPTAALRALTVFPSAVVLDRAHSEQRLGLLGEYADGRRWELTRAATYRSSAEKVAR